MASRSRWHRPTSSSSRWRRPIPVCAAIPPAAAASPCRWCLARWCACRCSSTSATCRRSIPAPANTSRARRRYSAPWCRRSAALRPTMNDWRPSATWEAVHRRADLFTTLRAFFAERGVLEVETPVLCSVGSTDLHLDQFSTHYRVPGAAAGRPFFLQTSPEFCMKRLLAAGSGPIYQLTKAFRNGEAGRRHNPEITKLEWYRPDYDHHALMDEGDALLQRVLATPPAERISYGALCERHLEIDPHRATTAELHACAARLNVSVSGALGDEQDAWLQLLWTHVGEPRLARAGRPLFVTDYPASQAMLAGPDHMCPQQLQPGVLHVTQCTRHRYVQSRCTGMQFRRRRAMRIDFEVTLT